MSSSTIRRPDSAARSRQVSLPQSRFVDVGQPELGGEHPQRTVESLAKHATVKHKRNFSLQLSSRPKECPAASISEASSRSLSPVLEVQEVEEKSDTSSRSSEDPWEYLKYRYRGPDGNFIPIAGDAGFLPVSNSTSSWQYIKVRPSNAHPGQRKGKRDLATTPACRPPPSTGTGLFRTARDALQPGGRRAKVADLPRADRRRSVSANDVTHLRQKVSRWRSALSKGPPLPAVHVEPACLSKRNNSVGGLPRSPTAGLRAWSTSLQTDLDASYITSGGSSSWLSKLVEQRQSAADSSADDSGIGMLSFSITSSIGEAEDEEQYDEHGGLLPPKYLLPFISRSGSSWQNLDASAGHVSHLQSSASRQSHFRRVSCPEILLTPSGSSLLEPTTLFKPILVDTMHTRLAGQALEHAATTFCAEPKSDHASTGDRQTSRPHHTRQPTDIAGWGSRSPRPPLIERSSGVDEDATIRPSRPRAIKRVSFSAHPGQIVPEPGSEYAFPTSEEGLGSRAKLELRPRDLNTDLEVRPWMVVAPRFVLEDCGVGVRDWDRDREGSSGSM